MHVGVNLRAAEVKGLNKHLKENCLSTTGVDLIVHSCCKLVGHLGVNPEYGRGGCWVSRVSAGTGGRGS